MYNLFFEQNIVEKLGYTWKDKIACTNLIWIFKKIAQDKFDWNKVEGTFASMAENLNYDVHGSVCYNNDPKNSEKYGRLYNLETAKLPYSLKKPYS
jgi:hypothetical protein